MLFQLLLVSALLLAAWAMVPSHADPMVDATLPIVGTSEFGRLVEIGHGLAMTGCVACHSADGGKPFAGGVPLDTPWGRIYSTNVTPDPQAGIGRYTVDDFERAVRQGVAPGGRTLNPAMPYARYARLSDTETKALYAFFMHGVEAAPDANRPADIVWPLSTPWVTVLWRRLRMPSLDAPATAVQDQR